MPKHFLSFLASCDGLTADQAEERAATKHFASPAPPALPDYQDYELMLQTLEVLEARYPFRAAVLELQTLVQILLRRCELHDLERLRQEDYARMIDVLNELSELASQCELCPKGRGADIPET